MNPYCCASKHEYWILAEKYRWPLSAVRQIEAFVSHRTLRVTYHVVLVHEEELLVHRLSQVAPAVVVHLSVARYGVA
jgi:hypothetical protein